jgi:hypothetical protein
MVLEMSIGAGLEDSRAVKDAYMKELVRKAYYCEQKSKREIAHELGIHRDMVSRLLKLEPKRNPEVTEKRLAFSSCGPLHGGDSSLAGDGCPGSPQATAHG